MKKCFTFLLAAVWLLAMNVPSWGQTRVNVTDVLTRESTGVTGTSYVSWQGVTSNSDAVYAGQSAGGNNSIQLRSNNNNSGIITTASGGTVTMISVIWNSNTSNGRTLNVYGSSSAYTSPTELYNAETQGTLIGTIICGTSTELAISDPYEYIGLRSNNAAMYLEEIDITWSTGGTQQNVSAPTFSPAGGVYGEPQTVTISCATAGATIYYTTDGSIPTTSSSVYSSPLTISETTTVKAMATKAGMNNSNVATATYTIQQMTNITTIAGLWELANTVGTTSTLTSVTFNNWYVTGVRNSQVCVSDGQYGFVIYQSGHGFEAGDKLNGTVTCNALMYQNHYAELTGVHASDLTVVSNQVMPLLTTTINNLQTQNYGTALDLDILTYNGTAFEDAQGNTITPYNNFNLTPSPLDNLVAGQQYDVKGVYIIYWSGGNPIQQIAPRSADDFTVVGTTPTLTVATPVISPEGGSYVNMVEVTITCATEGATIHYTTNGTTPTPTSPVYSQPLQIVDDVTVKAIAMKDGYEDSDVASATYSIFTPLAVSFSKVMNPVDINTTDSYLLVCEKAGTAATGTVSSSALQAVGVAYDSITHTVSTPVNYGDLPYQIGLEATEGGYFIAINEGYLNNASGTSLSIGSSANSVWALTPYEGGGFILKNTSNSNRYIGGTDAQGNAYKAYAISNLGGNTYPIVYLYKEGSTSPMLQVEAPTITPNGGLFTTTQELTLSCATEGAVIYYTTDGTDPTTSSTVYTAPFEVNATTTVKAMATAPAMINSAISTATFTFPSLMTIAEARALANNEYAYVEGIVTFMDGRNVYVQDATAGIVLYLNSNTVPSSLALGDKVRAYGKKTVYNGLVELTGINGGDQNVFRVESTNNTLPIVSKTIAEVLTGANGDLQSTRVLISNAVIGAIHTNANTVLKQGNDSINIYKIPALTGIVENSHVNVTAVVGYFNNPQLRVAYASDVELLNSNLAVTPNLLQGFTYEQGEGPSASQSFTVSGQYLVNAVTVTANQYFEISATAEGTYSNTLTLNTVNGTLAATPVYVRMIAGLSMNNYNSTITVTSGEDVVNVNVSGSVTISNAVATPTFTPAAGTYMSEQNVTLACATPDATIHYTLDGTDPDENSPVYTTPIAVNSDMTIKAIAMKANWLNSAIAVASYVIHLPMTIAEARLLENDQYATVQGVVTFMDGRNIYIQDATAAIVLYLNNNTVPATLAMGDLVRAYGKKSVYNGLVELSSINGNDATVFEIVSSGNTLPIAYKTIAEVLAGASGALQSTRVMISNAVIGAINPSNNTLLTQGNDNINIYHIPALTGITENDHVNVTAVVGYFNNPQLRVALASDVELLNYNLTVTPTSLEGFTYEQGEGPSTSQSFTVSGDYLTETVTVTANENYEIRTAAESTYTSTITLNTVNGVLASTPIFVRLAAGLSMGTYNSSVTVTSGTDVVTVNLTGNVTMSNAVATPTFTPAGGTYLEAQTVTISCATAGATIHYTLDGTDPTTSSPVYSTPISVTTDMTIKAMGVKDNWYNSEIATASYVIRIPMTIAEARQLNNNEYATVAGVVTHIDNRNVYIQDATAAIVLYLNNNTVPASLAQGDLVMAYGKKSVYNGLVELTSINGGNENEFMIVSSGNTLPLATKTIAEILTDYQGSNLLQSTRVCIQQAIVESINNSGNSLISQNGSEINIYHLPVVEGLVVGDFITFVGVVGCYNAPQMLIGSAGDITFTHRPTIATTPGSLNGFNYIVNNGPSTEQTLTVNGEHLVGSILVTPSSDYEISTITGAGFTPVTSITLTPTADSVVSNALVYVRMKAGLEIGQHSGQITLTSTSASDVVVNCSGIVYDQGGPTTNDWRRISSLSEIVEGGQVIIAARYDNENTNCYYAMTAATSGKPEGVYCETYMSGTDEILPESITNDLDTYAWTIGRLGDAYTFTNASGQALGYTSSTNFATGGDNIGWTITEGTSIDTGVMVANYFAFNIINANVTTRAAALNSNHNFGPYSTTNMTNGNGANYNFYLDIFVGSTGGTLTVSAPSFTPDGGTYYEAQEVVITCSTDEATIYYSSESETGPWTEYTEAILVDEDITLWAYAEKEGYENSAVVSASYVIQDDIVILFNQDWEGDWNGWTEVSVLGEPQWTIASYGGNHYAYANAYNQGETEDWLISPAFDLNAHPDAVLSFRTAKNYTGPELEVCFSNDYDGQNPGQATWVPILCPLSGGSWNWVSSGDISLSLFEGGNNCYIGFRYTSTEDQAAGWEVDDIMLYSGGVVPTTPYLIATPNTLSGFTHLEGQGPSDPQSFVLSGGNFLPTPPTWGTVTLSFGDLLPAYYEMSLDGVNYSTMLTIDLDETLTLEPTTVYVRLNGAEIGQYDASIVIMADPDTYIMVDLSGEVLSAEQPFMGSIVPLFIQGNNGSNNNRVPVAIAAYFGNLNPNSTYRYVNQFVDGNDGPETAGAGNVIFADPEGFYRTTSPSLATEGNYGEFTTDEYGEALLWCINEPTANARFTPGNHVFLRVRLNDGNDGTEVAHIFTTEDYSTVLNFGNDYNANQGSAFYVKSDEAPMTFAVLYNSMDDAYPIFATPIETTGVDYASINQYASFYKEEVAGKNGYFGGILPNDGEGVGFIEIVNMDFWVVNEYGTLGGVWGSTSTVHPSVGLDDPLFIDLTDVSVEEGKALEVKVWNFGHEFMVENDENNELDMMVFNVLGQPVLSKTIAAGSHVRFSHNLAEGLYIITLQNNKGKISTKVIVR